MKTFTHTLHVFVCCMVITHALHCSSRQTPQPDILTSMIRAEDTMKELQVIPSYGKSVGKMAKGAAFATLAGFTGYTMYIAQKMTGLIDPKELVACRTAQHAALAKSDYSGVPMAWSEYTFWGTCLWAAGIGMGEFGQGWVDLCKRDALENTLQKQTDNAVQAIHSQNGVLFDQTTGRLSSSSTYQRMRSTYQDDNDTAITLSLARIDNALTETRARKRN